MLNITRPTVYLARGLSEEHLNILSAAIAANDSNLFGNQLLRFSGITADEYITSDPIAIPAANREYAAVIEVCIQTGTEKIPKYGLAGDNTGQVCSWYR